MDPLRTRLFEISKATSDDELSKLKLFVEIIRVSYVAKLESCTCKSLEDVFYVLTEHYSESQAVTLLQAMLTVIGVKTDTVATLGSRKASLQAWETVPRFAFGKLVITLCNSLNDEQFNSLKNLLNKCLGGLHPDKVKSREDFFSILIRGRYITLGDLSNLVSSFNTLELLDCVQLVEEFRTQVGSVQDTENGTFQPHLVPEDFNSNQLQASDSEADHVGNPSFQESHKPLKDKMTVGLDKPSKPQNGQVFMGQGNYIVETETTGRDGPQARPKLTEREPSNSPSPPPKDQAAMIHFKDMYNKQFDNQPSQITHSTSLTSSSSSSGTPTSAHPYSIPSQETEQDPKRGQSNQSTLWKGARDQTTSGGQPFVPGGMNPSSASHLVTTDQHSKLVTADCPPPMGSGGQPGASIEVVCVTKVGNGGQIETHPDSNGHSLSQERKDEDTVSESSENDSETDQLLKEEKVVTDSAKVAYAPPKNTPSSTNGIHHKPIGRSDSEDSNSPLLGGAKSYIAKKIRRFKNASCFTQCCIVSIPIAVPIGLILLILAVFFLHCDRPQHNIYPPVDTLAAEDDLVILDRVSGKCTPHLTLSEVLHHNDYSHENSIYTVSLTSSKLQIHQKVANYTSITYFQSDPSRSTGRIDYRYLLSGSVINYTLCVASTSSEEDHRGVYIFNNHTNYVEFVSYVDGSESKAAYSVPLEIPANNITQCKDLTYTVKKDAYYFIVADTPGNIYYHYNYTFKVNYIKRSDYKWHCDLYEPIDCKVNVSRNDEIAVLAYVKPSEASNPFTTHIRIDYGVSPCIHGRCRKPIGFVSLVFFILLFVLVIGLSVFYYLWLKHSEHCSVSIGQSV